MNKKELIPIARELMHQYAEKEVNEGYKPYALHIYHDKAEKFLYFRMRLKHPVGEKWIRPFHWDENSKKWVMREPKFQNGKPLYRLPLLVKNLMSEVWIVEGEQKVDALEKLGCIATTSGGATSADLADWEILRERKVVIWRDADQAGLDYSKAVTSILESLNCSISYIDVEKLNLPDGGDVIDWLKDNPNASQQDILSLPRSEYNLTQDIPESSWSEPLALTNTILPNPYPIEALPKQLREAVIEVQGFTKAPIPLVAASAITALSLAGQTYVDMQRAEKLFGPTGLFFITVADSGERKSTCDGFFIRSILEYEQMQKESAKPAVKKYNAEQAIWQAKHDAIKTKIRQLVGKGQDTQTQERELINLEQHKPTPPKFPRLIYSDATPEALKRNLVSSWPSAGIISSEGGVVFGSHGMNKESVMRNLATYNQAWDGKSVPTDRVGSESLGSQEVRLTLGIQVQESTIREFTSQLGSLARGTGFFARVLFSWPESTQGSRFYSDPPENWPALSHFNEQISNILKITPPINEKGNITPKLMRLAPLAKLAWVRFHDNLESELCKDGALYDIRDFASKAADNAARLACLFHLFEFGCEGEVSEESFDRASLIIFWHLEEAQRFFGELALPQELINVKLLDEWLISHCIKEKKEKILFSTILQFGPKRLRKSALLTNTLKELEELGRVRFKINERPMYVEINSSLLKKGEK